MADKNSFILRNEYNDIFMDLSDKQAGILIKTVFTYAVKGEIYAGLTDEALKMAFRFIKLNIDYDNAKYQAKCKTNRLNGKLANATERGRTLPNATERGRTLPNATERGRTLPNATERGLTDSDSDSDKKRKILKKEKAETLPPLFAEFWELYEKKHGKQECIDWWRKNSDKRQAAIEGLAWYNQTREVKEGYILDPIRYLKKQRWQDVPPDWKAPKVRGAEPQEPQLSAEELAEQARWNSLTEEERKAELDKWREESGGEWKPQGGD